MVPYDAKPRGRVGYERTGKETTTIDVSVAIDSRISCRAFRPDPVDSALLRELIEQAARAASGGNLQP